MSNENFDKKIREKLVNHIPKYDSGAWQNFSKLLPAPWYTKLFTNNLGWVLGGISTSALIFTIYLTNTKNELLNDEISTLKNQIETKSEIIPNAVAQTDTVYITQEVNKYIRITEEKSFQAGMEKGYADASKDIAYLQSEINLLRKEQLAQTKNQLLTPLSESQNEFLLVGDNGASDKPSGASSAKSDMYSSDESKVTGNQYNDESVANNQSQTSEELQPEKEVLDKSIEAIVENEIEEVPSQIDKATPETPKKKINWPKMRFGINTDYLGLKVFSTGPAFEVFLSDKVSFNASAIFSGQVETKHPFAKDFNKITGKDFDNEYKPFVAERTELIEDISIKTSFIKLPLYFNYYINTWSRFNFLISAGTKLDLSVYQDVGYFSGPLGFQTRSRFEAKAKPKTFNNLFYGMGLQYQYRGFVGQVTPYFDFAFRQADYFVPARNFGINASLKFQFGK